MINNQYVCRLRNGFGAMKGAGATGAFDTCFAGAGIIFGRDTYPDFPFRGTRKIQLAAVPTLIIELPDHYLGKYPHFILSMRTIMTHVFQSPRAKIIRTALQHRETKIKIERLTEVRKVALDELIL